MKKGLIALFILVFCMSVACMSYADSHKGGGKAGFILKNAEALGLSDEQIQEIEEIKIETEEEVAEDIKDIKEVYAKMKEEMYKDDSDEDTVNDLIDKKYDLKKEKTKYLISQFNKAKKVLTPEQSQMLKEICKKSKDKECSLDKRKCPCSKEGSKRVCKNMENCKCCQTGECTCAMECKCCKAAKACQAGCECAKCMAKKACPAGCECAKCRAKQQ